MALRRPIIDIAGQLQELPTTDSLVTGVTAVTVDFGTAFVDEATFQIVDAAALTTSRVLTWVGGTFPDGRDADELEMDGLMLSALCSVDGVITVVAAASPGPVTGQYRLLYQLG